MILFFSCFYIIFVYFVVYYMVCTTCICNWCLASSFTHKEGNLVDNVIGFGSMLYVVTPPQWFNSMILRNSRHFRWEKFTRNIRSWEKPWHHLAIQVFLWLSFLPFGFVMVPQPIKWEPPKTRVFLILYKEGAWYVKIVFVWDPMMLAIEILGQGGFLEYKKKSTWSTKQLSDWLI